MNTLSPVEFIGLAKFNSLVSDESAVVHFANKTEEREYERLDAQLIKRIQRIYDWSGHREGDGIHHIEDWWPNHLRGLESDPSLFQLSLLLRLQDLLTGRLKRWRIIIHYYHGLKGSQGCGSALVLSDRILATVTVACC